MTRAKRRSSAKPQSSKFDYHAGPGLPADEAKLPGKAQAMLWRSRKLLEDCKPSGKTTMKRRRQQPIARQPLDTKIDFSASEDPLSRGVPDDHPELKGQTAISPPSVSKAAKDTTAAPGLGRGPHRPTRRTRSGHTHLISEKHKDRVTDADVSSKGEAPSPYDVATAPLVDSDDTFSHRVTDPIPWLPRQSARTGRTRAGSTRASLVSFSTLRP